MTSAADSKRAATIARGGNLLGFMPVTGFDQISTGTVITFLYNSKGPGAKKRSYYDFNPLIIFLGLGMSKAGKPFAIGFNTHYCESFVDRSRVILRYRAGLRLPSSLWQDAVKAYRLDRIISPMYRGISIAVDPAILNSEGIWRAANSLTSD